MRDKFGRFTSGHTVLAARDSATGRFISDSEFRYRAAVSDIDFFLDNRRAA